VFGIAAIITAVDEYNAGVIKPVLFGVIGADYNMNISLLGA